MKTYIQHPGGIARPVKNLGWLLRNWRNVDSFSFYYSPAKTGCVDGVLSARMTDGSFYRTEFACLSVCFRFLRRPVFDGLTLAVYRAAMADAFVGDAKDPRKWVIGSDEYRALLRADAAPFAGLDRTGAAQEYNLARHRATLAAILP